jgi:hypothetical protein
MVITGLLIQCAFASITQSLTHTLALVLSLSLLQIVIRVFLDRAGTRFKSVDAPYGEPTPILDIREKVARKLKPLDASKFRMFVFNSGKGMARPSYCNCQQHY